jgi:polyisoprenoid-binding protein YceI
MSVSTSALLTSPAATRSTWKIDNSHSLVEFSARHMMFTTVKGRFANVEGIISDVSDDPTQSSVEVTIDAASITTADPQRDAHLRSADFFDVEQYPTITFKSRRIEGSLNEFKLIGDLTMRGQTREVSLDVTFNGVGITPFGSTAAGFTAEGKLNRKDWGLNWNVGLEAGGVLVSDQIKLSLEIEATRQDS